MCKRFLLLNIIFRFNKPITYIVRPKNPPPQMKITTLNKEIEISSEPT